MRIKYVIETRDNREFNRVITWLKSNKIKHSSNFKNVFIWEDNCSVRHRLSKWENKYGTISYTLKRRENDNNCI